MLERKESSRNFKLTPATVLNCEMNCRVGGLINKTANGWLNYFKSS